MQDERVSYPNLVTESRKREKKALDMFAELVKYPSVATRDHATILECASCVEDQLRKFGYSVRQFPTGGSPVVFAERNVGAPKTLLFYQHYDVQPEDPIESWSVPPWQLTVKGERFYGRGANDDKGPYVANLIGMSLIEDMLGQLPVNVKFVVEGEEETGSEHLPEFAIPNGNLLKADGAVFEALVVNPGSSSEIMTGAKGCAYFELSAEGTPQFPRTDAHSGFGGAIPNAAWRLIWALASLKNAEENILIEGFRDMVKEPSPEDLAALDNTHRSLEKVFADEYGVARTILDRKGLDLKRAVYLEPCVSVCGFESGYNGPGSKTITPARARAKVDFRLVPDLTEEKVEALLRSHLERRGFSDIQVRRIDRGYDPAKTPISNPFVQLVHRAATEIASPAPVDLIPMSWGSGPLYLLTPHAPCCIMVSDSDLQTNTHAPDENWILTSMCNSMAFVALVAERMAAT
ncbi:MAG: M20/M25/M40 family metallo-hydrolase [Thermoplasmata archaeon]|nr:M20/M25/M40 family metallo-hydrolase [Thermoplasmata archaeon]